MDEHTIHVEDHVRLMKNVPELMLHRGDVGVVCSIWHAASSAFEVEFPSTESKFGIRTVLCEDEVAKDEGDEPTANPAFGDDYDESSRSSFILHS